jgi:hypothetical protein
VELEETSTRRDKSAGIARKSAESVGRFLCKEDGIDVTCPGDVPKAVDRMHTVQP